MEKETVEQEVSVCDVAEALGGAKAVLAVAFTVVKTQEYFGLGGRSIHGQKSEEQETALFP